MAYRRRSTRRNTSSRKRVRKHSGGGYSARSGRAAHKPVRSRKRYGKRSGHSRRSSRGVLQTLRIELAPGLSVGGGSPIARPVAARRTKHF